MIATRLVGQMPTTAPRRICTMAAAIVTGPQRVRLEMVPRPEVGAGQVRVRVAGCVVSPTDGAAWVAGEGWGNRLRPGEPGVEVWGVVEACGEDVAAVAEGEAVAVVTRAGFAEYVVERVEQVVALPEQLARAEGPAGEPGVMVAGAALGRAMNVWRRVGIVGGERAAGGGPGRVAIVGMGLVGLSLTQMAHAAGVEVVAISRRSEGVAAAKRCGATEALWLSSLAETEAAAEALTGEMGFDRVIEASGAAGPTALAGRIVSTGGRLVLSGGSLGGGARENCRAGDLWRRADVELVSGRTRDVATAVRGLEEAMAAVAEGRLRLEMLAARRFGLPRLGEAMTLGGGAGRQAVRTWVSPWQ